MDIELQHFMQKYMDEILRVEILRLQRKLCGKIAGCHE